MAVSQLSASQSIQPLYFGDPQSPLFGVINPAREAAQRGVLICAPIGYENVIYHRQLGILARRLAAKGRPVLRFDWPGCGDSAGDDDSPGLIERSLASVQEAADALRERTGVEHVDLIGLRFGATLAGSALAGEVAVSDVVLWDPFPSGRSYLRAVRAFDRLTYRASEQLEGVMSATSATGFFVAPSTLAGIEKLDLTRAEFGSPRRIMISGREGTPLDKLVEHIRSLGHDVTLTELTGLREVALGWGERPVPTESFARIESWLGCPEPLPEGPTSPVSPLPTISTEVAMPGGVLERPFVWAGDRPLLGITATHDAVGGNDSWMMFIPNRYARRIGPSGLYRRWARSWATLGLPTFRVDVNGTGDAGGPDEETDRDMYQPEGVDDARRAVAFLRERQGARRIAVIGLCSGGFVGFQAALHDAAIKDVFLLNPQMLFWTEHETAVSRAGTFKTRIWRAKSWRRLLRDPGTWLPRVLPLIRESMLADLKWRVAKVRGRSDRPGAVSVSESIRAAVAQLGQRGCRLHFIFSEGDAGLAYLERHLGSAMTGLADQPHVTIDIVEGADHSFKDLGRQVALHDLVASRLIARGYGLRAIPDIQLQTA